MTAEPKNSFKSGDKSFFLNVRVTNCWCSKLIFLKLEKNCGIALKALIMRIPPKPSSIAENKNPNCSCPFLAVRFKLLPILEITNAEIGNKNKETKVNSGLKYIKEATLMTIAKGSLKINSSKLTTATSISPTSLFMRAIKSPFRSLE